MALDNLLTRLKADVSPVAAVQANNSKASGCNGSETADVAGVSPMAAARKFATAATARNVPAVSSKPAPLRACTAATAATVEKTIADDDPLKVGAGGSAEPFDREAWKERTISENDGELSGDDAEAVAWHEDDRRRCRHCLHLLPNGICKVASPGGLVSANSGYRPVDIPRRCEGYRPCLDDPDTRPGRERWPGLTDTKGAIDANH